MAGVRFEGVTTSHVPPMAIGPPATVLRLAGGGLLLAAAVLLAPARAAAGCGDYVTILNDGPTGDHSPSDRDPAKPCHGPGCSGSPVPFDLPLTAPVTESGGPRGWADRSAGDAPEADGPDWAFTPTAPVRPIHRARPIFHPPPAV
jgi:hypothetical protein